jgi:hypothetical protein
MVRCARTRATILATGPQDRFRRGVYGCEQSQHRLFEEEPQDYRPFRPRINAAISESHLESALGRNYRDQRLLCVCRCQYGQISPDREVRTSKPPSTRPSTAPHLGARVTPNVYCRRPHIQSAISNRQSTILSASGIRRPIQHGGLRFDVAFPVLQQWTFDALRPLPQTYHLFL